MISNLVSMAKLAISVYPFVHIFKWLCNEISELVSYEDWDVHDLAHLGIYYALTIVPGGV